MYQDINYQKAIALLNQTIQQMKSELSEVDSMPLKGEKKQMAQSMHQILEKIEKKTEEYEKSQTSGDFNSVCGALEALKPSFILNYNEICYDSGLDILENTLIEMEEELSQVDQMELSEDQEEKVYSMHQIYDQVSAGVEKFAASHEHEDFLNVIEQLEQLQPEFVLNYNLLL